MEQRIDRNKILWAALVMMVGAALVTGSAHAAEGDAPAGSDPGVVTENPGPGPSDPGPGGPGNSDGQPGGGNDNEPGNSGGGRDQEEDRGGDPGVIIGGPPVFQPGPQPGPGPIAVPEPQPEPQHQPDFEQPGPTMPSHPDRPSPRPDHGRDNPVRNEPPSTRIDNFQNIPTVNAPLVSAQPTQSTTRDNQTRSGTAAYDNGSSIIFKAADEVASEESPFGMSASQGSPSSSMQQMFVGTIVAVDKSKNTVVLKDRYRHTRTFFVDSGTAQTLRKGNVVQATFLPGTSKVERLQQIIG